MLDAISPPTAEELQERYEFTYYSTLSGAIADVNADTVGTNADSAKDNAVAGIYSKDDVPNVVLLKNTTEFSQIDIYKDMLLYLGGNTITFDNVRTGFNLGYEVGDKNIEFSFTIDGRVDGSRIEAINDSPRAVQQVRGKLTVLGGEYIAEGSSSGVATFMIQKLYDSVPEQEFSNCNIIARSSSSYSYAIYTKGTVTNVSNCKLFADAKSMASSSGKYSNAMSVFNSIVTLKNNITYGTHSGVNIGNGSKVYVQNGTYEGTGHGGFYISHGSSGEAYFNNVKMSCVDYKGVYSDYDFANSVMQGGVYIGSCSDMSVNMNNCSISGGNSPIVLRGTDGEQNNTLYISNSKIIGYSSKIRLDNDTMKLVLGVGNNFTADDTTRPSCVTTTTETYVKQ